MHSVPMAERRAEAEAEQLPRGPTRGRCHRARVRARGRARRAAPMCMARAARLLGGGWVPMTSHLGGCLTPWGHWSQRWPVVARLATPLDALLMHLSHLSHLSLVDPFLHEEAHENAATLPLLGTHTRGGSEARTTGTTAYQADLRLGPVGPSEAQPRRELGQRTPTRPTRSAKERACISTL